MSLKPSKQDQIQIRKLAFVFIEPHQDAILFLDRKPQSNDIRIVGEQTVTHLKAIFWDEI